MKIVRIPSNYGGVALAAQEGAETIGRILLVSPFHVEDIYVNPEWRGKGVAQELVSAIESEAKIMGLTKVFAYATDETMQHFTERLKYRPLPWVVMEKELCR